MGSPTCWKKKCVWKAGAAGGGGVSVTAWEFQYIHHVKYNDIKETIYVYRLISILCIMIADWCREIEISNKENWPESQFGRW